MVVVVVERSREMRGRMSDGVSCFDFRSVEEVLWMSM